MPATTIAAGSLLIVIGVVGSAVAASMVDEWWYAAIPALIGLILVVCGKVGSRGKTARIIAMHLAPIVAVVGIIGSFMPSGLNFSSPGSVAFVSSIFRLLTILVCSVFVILCVRSFVSARRS